MKIRHRSLVTAFALAILFGFSTPVVQANGPGEGPEVVVQWNQLLQDTIPATAGVFSPRYYAMLHIAMFDAVNSIEGDFTRYRTRVFASQGASSSAAAAQAAHDILVALIPASQAAYDTALAANLAGIPPGPAAQGVAVGKSVAEKILAWRANDGSAAAPPPFVLPTIPGLWQPTGAPAAATQLPGMTPFGLLTATQFLPPRHPELTSNEYATAFEEVKTVGSATSATRTPDKTQLARLFAGLITRTTAFAAWNNVARDAATAHHLSLDETARAFALLNASMMDGLLTSHSSKFIYGLWRPLTAIRRADEDLNPNTIADPAWNTLIPTPAYPSYAGNMACVGAASARALQLAFGTDDFAFTVIWRGNATSPVDVPKSYTSFWQLAVDEANSRIYGGIHFRFDNTVSQAVCPKVAEFVHATRMKPKDH
jgi:hypothetical protein